MTQPDVDTTVVTTSMVFGYVRLDPPDGYRADLFRRRIAQYCAGRGLALELTFADNGVPDTATTRPGWTALLDALSRTGANSVVIPALGHLSRNSIVRGGVWAVVGCGAAVCGSGLAGGLGGWGGEAGGTRAVAVPGRRGSRSPVVARSASRGRGSPSVGGAAWGPGAAAVRPPRPLPHRGQ